MGDLWMTSMRGAGRDRLWRIGLLCSVVAGLLGASAGRLAAQQGVLRGRVLSLSGESIVNAEVIEASGKGRALTDGRGEFELKRVAPGVRSFFTRASGYEPLSFELEFMAGDDIRMELVMTPRARRADSAQALPDVVATAPVSLLRRELNERIESGLGTFLTRQEIERRNPPRVLDLLRTTRSARVGTTRAGRPFLAFGQCRAIGVWIDGTPSTLSAEDALGLVFPRDIEAMEIYSGASQMPGQFGKGTNCAAVVIWTRGFLQ